MFVVFITVYRDIFGFCVLCVMILCRCVFGGWYGGFNYVFCFNVFVSN